MTPIRELAYYLLVTALSMAYPMYLYARRLLNSRGSEIDKKDKHWVRAVAIAYAVWYTGVVLLLIAATYLEKLVLLGLVGAVLWTYIANRFVITNTWVLDGDNRRSTSAKDDD